jgi:hypothetical protein
MRISPALAGAAVAAVVLSGCTGGTSVSTSSSDAAGGYRLYVADASSSPALQLVDTTTGKVLRDLPMGAAAPDWSRVYTLSQAGGRSTLSAVDTKDGTVRWRMTIEAGYGLPAANVRGDLGGLSPNGQWLALERHLNGKSDFLVVETSLGSTVRQVHLAGTFAYDGLNNPGTNLYLTETLSAQTGHYRVVRYDLQGGALDPNTIVDKREVSSAAMTGTRIAGAFSPNGDWQYSLYVSAHGAFIHALNLTATYAWCIDLPGTQVDLATQRQWALAVKSDGSVLLAANPVLGTVAEVWLTDGPLAVSRTASFAALSGPGRMAFGAAALSHDQHTLFASAGRGVVAIDTSSLNARTRYLQDARIGTLVASPDGAWLYASSPDGGAVWRVDPSSGQSTQVFSPGTTVTLYGVQSP